MKIKEEFKSVIITQGKLTLNAKTTNPSEYEYYYHNGFKFMFEEETTPEEKPISTKNKKKIRYKGI
jgi:hypothetical protein